MCSSSVFQNGYFPTHPASISAGESKTFPAVLGCPWQAGRADAPTAGAGFVSPDPDATTWLKTRAESLQPYLPVPAIASRIRTVLIWHEH